MIGLLEMLMQTTDDRILLLPIWPKDGEVDFKLHGPGKTVVEATVRDGKITRQNVRPAARERVVVVWSP